MTEEQERFRQKLLHWTLDEQAMFLAGDAITKYLNRTSGGRWRPRGEGDPNLMLEPWPGDDLLFEKVWKAELDRVISPDLFYQVCKNVRNGFSAIGDD